MATRKALSKKSRFDVFKRDSFTCQYCGAQPPSVALEVDHITPVAGGGTNDMSNLITSCPACNAGKSDRPLSSVPMRPDADLMFLQVQQEIAELRRYQEAIALREEEALKLVTQLQEIWSQYSGLDWYPSSGALRPLLDRYPVNIVVYAVSDVAAKVGTGYLKDKGDRWLRYLYSVCRNTIANDQEGR